jgi:hypothetical protein
MRTMQTGWWLSTPPVSLVTTISPTESASVLVRAVDHTNLANRITTGTLSDLTEYDFVLGKIGLQRDTRAYIGSADSRTTLHGLNDTSAPVVKVSAENLGNVTGEVFSDFVEYQSSTFARESVQAHVQNAELNVQGLEVTASNSSAYATVAEENSNTVRGVTTAHVVDSTVVAGPGGVTLFAVDETSYNATSDGQGGRSSLNDVRKYVTAHVADSTITVTGGSIHITADNRTAFNATSTLTPTESDSPFASLFATAGILATNVVNGDVLAYAEGSTLTTTTAGSISLQADNAATIDARVKGQATATSGLPVAPALSLGAAVAFNAVGWDAFNVLLATLEDFVGNPSNDWIEEILPFAESTPARAHAYLLDTQVAVADDLTIQARSAAQINATVSNAAESTTSSLFGTFSAAAGGVLASNKISSSVEARIAYSEDYSPVPESDDASAGGTISLLASDDAGIYANCKLVSSSMTTNDGGASILQEGMNYLIPADFLSSDGSREIEFGQRVRLTSDYDSSRGTPDAVYQYLGTTATLDLADTDYIGLGLWKPVPVSNLVPQGYNVSGSSAIALGGLVVLNEVRSDVEAYVGVNAAEDGAGTQAAAPHVATVTAAAVTVTALENATIFATADSTAAASGGSAFGTGTVIAVNGTIATNVVLSQAHACATDSDLTTNNGGDVVVQAANSSAIDARISSDTTSNGVSVGVMLAFNTIGWDAQNFLFNTVDALLGTGIGTEIPAEAKASIERSEVDAAGAIRVNALSDARVDSEIASSSTAIKATFTNSTAVSVGVVIAMNKSSTLVHSVIDDATAVITRDGDVQVTAYDASRIESDVQSAALSVSASTTSALSVSVGLSVARNEIRNDTQAYVRDVANLAATSGSVMVGARVTVAASNRSNIDATVKAIAVSGGVGTGMTPAVAIGFSLARNLIGWREFGDKDPLEVRAYVQDTGDADTTAIHAARGLTLTATASGSIRAVVEATAVALAASTSSAFAVAGAGLWTDNKMAAAVQAEIVGADLIDVDDGGVSLRAANTASILADAQAVAMTASLAGSTGGAVSIGVSLAHNKIDNDIAAFIRDTSSVLTNGTGISITATDQATIQAVSTAAAVSVGIGGSTGLALSGAGATNIILTRTNAFAQRTAFGSDAEPVGAVAINAVSTADIDARIAAVAGSISFGGSTGVGVALGIGVARNFIGWDPSGTTVTADHDSDTAVEQLATGQKVRVASGPLDGEVFEYLQAAASGSIDAIVLAGAVTLSGGGTTGVGVSGAGVYTENKIANLVQACIGGDGATGITADSVTLTASDTSGITADVAAASLAGSVGGTGGVSVSIGIALARNHISS